MRRIVLWLCASALAVALAPAISRAGPPFVTDDPVPVDLHHWEFYLASANQVSRDEASGTFPEAEANYGGARNLQLHVRLPLDYTLPSGHDAHFALDDLELGAKYRFLEEGKRVPMAAIYPAFEVPLSGEARGSEAGKLEAFFPLWIQKSFGSWTSYAGGGYWVNPGDGNQNYWLAGWQVGRNVAANVAAGAEIFGATADEVGGRGSLRLNLGATIDFSERQHLLLSAGHSISGDSAFQGYVGYQITL